MSDEHFTQDDHPSWTLDDSTVASNPGRLRIDRWRWFSHYPKWPLIWFTSLAMFVVLACGVHWSFWIAAALLLLANWFYWRRVREHFWSGCANPAMVVSLQPMLIAVSTDLTKGYGEYPAVKIIKKSLKSVDGQIPRVGSRLATVALYASHEPDESPHWIDFDPRPVECVTDDQEAISRVVSSFTDDDWNELGSLLRYVPQPFRPGLYPLWPT